MAISLAQAQAQLDAWLNASLAVASGKSYTLANGVSVTRENAKYIQAQITYWNRMVSQISQASTGRGRVIHAIPLDI